jgi:IMP dehydrogenase/GMP reductase
MDNIKFDYNNILIVPQVNTDIASRYKDIVLPDMLPLFTAPMDTVVDLNNMRYFLANRINVTLPRTISYELFLENTKVNTSIFTQNLFISLGLQDMERHYKTNFGKFHNGAHILIDVANGHMQKIVDIAREVRRLRPDITLMVGNIANPEAYAWYAKNGCVDYIRVGIGNGNGCLTTKQSGVGYPGASLIQETYKVKQTYIKANPNAKRIPAIVADGGMKDYVDVIKALALGADYVMIGSIFNKAFESCAKNYVFYIPVNDKIANYCLDHKIPVMKHFRGMSTKDAQKAMGKTVFKTSEGVVRYRRVEYRLQGWIENFEHYLRNAMSYANAKTLDDFIGKADVCQITKAAYDRFNK